MTTELLLVFPVAVLLTSLLFLKTKKKPVQKSQPIKTVKATKTDTAPSFKKYHHKQGYRKLRVRIQATLDNCPTSMSVMDIRSQLNKEGITFTPQSVYDVLYRLKKEGKIGRVAEGRYKSARHLLTLTTQA